VSLSLWILACILLWISRPAFIFGRSTSLLAYCMRSRYWNSYWLEWVHGFWHTFYRSVYHEQVGDVYWNVRDTVLYCNEYAGSMARRWSRSKVWKPVQAACSNAHIKKCSNIGRASQVVFRASHRAVNERWWTRGSIPVYTKVRRVLYRNVT